MHHYAHCFQSLARKLCLSLSADQRGLTGPRHVWKGTKKKKIKGILEKYISAHIGFITCMFD